MHVLGIFVKHPVPGQVKTRLAQDVGDEHAARLYEAFTADIVNRYLQTADRRVLCFTPNTSEAHGHFSALAESPVPPDGPAASSAELRGSDRLQSEPPESARREPRPPGYNLWPQPDGPLGERLREFFAHAFAGGATRVVVIGSDSPTLPHDFVDRAFALLDHHDCVLGPATDGGYYLIGQSGQPRPIFSNVEWGSPRVFEQTVALTVACGSRLALLPQWYDVDTAADLELLRKEVAGERNNGKAPSIPRTRQMLDDFRNP